MTAAGGWRPIEIGPPVEMLVPTYEGGPPEIRCFVWVEGEAEPSTGGCRLMIDEMRWYADGKLGNWKITHWKPYGPPPPEDTPHE